MPNRGARAVVAQEAWNHVVAVSAVLTAFLLKLIIDPIVDQQTTPFLLFSAAIMLSAWYGGWKSGLTATVLAILILGWFYVPPDGFDPVEPATTVRLGVFLLEGAIICLLAGALHRTKGLAAQRAIAAEAAKNEALAREADFRRVQAEISARDLMFHRLVEANVVGVMVCESSGRVTDANNAFLQMIEYTRGDLESGAVDWRKLTPQEYIDLDERLLEQLRSQGRFEAVEKEYIAKSGRRVPIWIGGAGMTERDRIICFVMDLTFQKQAERELRKAKEAAERANRARGEFLANVSHELRTPMNAILGMTDLALDEDLPAQVREYLETASESARTLLFLLNDLLDFSRIEAGRIEFESAPFSLRNTLDQAMKILALRASEKGLELACSVASDVPDAILGDQGRVRQIILNLVGNAIKFTEQGEVVVNVRRSPGSEAGGKVVRLQIAVSDTGVGIKPEDREKIFQPFTQADASLTRQHGGAGLGLAITRKLVSLMDGTIEVESEIGRGTTFRVDLRLPRAEPGRLRPYGMPKDVDELRGLPVLVVDDNVTTQEILKEMLLNWSMRPTVVGDGREALRVMREHARYDCEFPLILVDALMPSMDGFQFLEVATREDLLCGAAVMMVSSTDRKLFESRLRELPIAGLVEKPVSQSDLLDSVMTVLKGPQLESDAVRRVQTTRAPLSVLVAEDTPANQKVVEAILKKRGHQVTIARNGREALELVTRQNFDVVLMDVQMPTVDGWQATRAIRQLPDPRRAGVPILAMTAHAMRGDRERCLDAGMDDYIAKPLDSAELIHQVERLGRLKGGTRMQESDSPQHPRKRQTPEPSPTNHSEVDGPLLDRVGTLRRLGDDEDLLKEMARFYLDDAPTLLENLRTADSGAEAIRAAHTLKGLASNFGAALLVETAVELEQSAKLGDVDPGLLAQVETLSKRLSDELKDLINED